MALPTTNSASPLLVLQARTSHFRDCSKPNFCPLAVKTYQSSIVAKAGGKTSETSLSVVQSVQTALESSEDRLALVGLGFGAVAALWASSNLVSAVDKLPLLPTLLELVGIIYSSWFIYRYLVFRAPREDFLGAIKKSLSDIMNQ